MAGYSQDNRGIGVKTPLGKDVLLLESIEGTEELSRPFQYRLRMFSTNQAVAFGDILGQPVTVNLKQTGNNIRYFNGYVSSFQQVFSDGPNNYYEAIVVPWTWFLNGHADCRIFQKMTVPAIIQQIFSDRGYSDFQLSLNGSYRTREFCVQYRETDFAFISRLMEEEGMYYFFQHQDGKHTMVLADGISAHQAAANHAKLGYQSPGRNQKENGVTDWRTEQLVQPGAFALTDYDFTAPSKSLACNSQNTRGVAQSKNEIFNYPGGYLDTNDGDNYVKYRMQERQCQYELMHGQTVCRGVVTGCTFTLADHPRADQNQEYLTTQSRLFFSVGNYFTGQVGVADEKFECQFSAIAASQQFRPPRVTPRPFIRGLQTAVVVGPSGQEIATDSYGRVKVQFHWDRYGTSDENSSCFIRVAQVWAGKQWGAIFIPRIGQEVVVAFLEGDPDKPLITGSVYNADQKVPYTLPDNATQSGITTNSSTGGGGSNQIRFEDKAGSEDLYIHAQKTMNLVVEDTFSESHGKEHHVTTKTDKFEHIKGKNHLTVDSDAKDKLGGDYDLAVSGNAKEKIGGDYNLNVSGKAPISIGGQLSLSVTGDVVEVFSGNHSEATTKNYYIKAAQIVIEAQQGVSIVCGSNSLVIDSSGVSVNGSMITINASGMTKINSGPGSSAQSGSAGSADSPADPIAPTDATLPTDIDAS